MSVWIQSMAAVGVLSALPLVGALVLFFDPAVVKRAVPPMARVAIGALAGAVLFDLIPDALSSGASRASIALAVVAGIAGFGLLDHLFQRFAAGCAERRIVWLNFVGDVFHNAIDGMLIAASFLANPSLGILATVAVGLHELPREMGSLGIFLHGGLSVRRAYALNVLTGVGALGGALVTLLVGAHARGLANAMIPIAAGTFLYIAASLLRSLPIGSRARLAAAGWIAAGFALTALAAR